MCLTDCAWKQGGSRGESCWVNLIDGTKQMRVNQFHILKELIEYLGIKKMKKCSEKTGEYFSKYFCRFGGLTKSWTFCSTMDFFHTQMIASGNRKDLKCVPLWSVVCVNWFPCAVHLILVLHYPKTYSVHYFTWPKYCTVLTSVDSNDNLYRYTVQYITVLHYVIIT